VHDASPRNAKVEKVCPSRLAILSRHSHMTWLLWHTFLHKFEIMDLWNKRSYFLFIRNIWLMFGLSWVFFPVVFKRKWVIKGARVGLSNAAKVYWHEWSLSAVHSTRRWWVKILVFRFFGQWRTDLFVVSFACSVCTYATHIMIKMTKMHFPIKTDNKQYWTPLLQNLMIIIHIIYNNKKILV